MARTVATNFTSTLQFPKATAATDLFKKEDVQTLAEAVDQHDHSSGKGVVVSVAGIAAGAINGSAITDNTITSAKITDATIVAADIANATVTNAKLASDTARANLLTNGGFEIWQRGNGPFTTSWAADRWSLIPAGTDTFSVSRNTANVDTGSTACAAATFTLANGGGASIFFQSITATDFPGLGGRTVSVSVRVRTSTANAVRIALNNYYSGTNHLTYSSFHSGDGTYQTLSATGPLDPTAQYVQLHILFAASCTAYLDNAMLVVGSQAADYAPMHPADDLARCLRYYEASTGGAVVSGIATAAGQSIFTAAEYKQVKPVIPTVTFDGYANSNAPNVTINIIGQGNVRLGTSSAAAGPFYSIANMYVEANP